MDDLNRARHPGHSAPIVIALAVACVVLLVIVHRAARGARRSSTAGSPRLTARRATATSLEAILEAHLDKVYAVAREVDELGARTAVLERTQRRAFQRIGLVRFNPFEDTGGNQSFALALLDQQGDGFVVSSLHARAGTRVYGKAVAERARRRRPCPTRRAEALRLALASGSGPAKAG